MRNMSQFKAIVAAVLLNNPDNKWYKNMIYQNYTTFDYVTFFACSLSREMIIPGFNHVLEILEGKKQPTAEDNKYMEFPHRTEVPKVTTLEREFWQHYVRNCIHDFCKQTWQNHELSSNMLITRNDASHILAIASKVRHYGPRNIIEWEKDIVYDYMSRHEITYSSLFDVKMSYVGEVGDGKKRPVVLWSYGSKAWANCMTFHLRMQWNRMQVNTI